MVLREMIKKAIKNKCKIEGLTDELLEKCVSNLTHHFGDSECESNTINIFAGILKELLDFEGPYDHSYEISLSILKDKLY